MIAAAAGFVGLFGLAIGSFLNVVAYRVPNGLSVVRPPSACPGCDAPIRGRDNVPVLSWVLLRGRCRNCRAAISARYPLIEAFTAVAFAVIALVFAPELLSAESPASAVAAALALIAFLYLAAISIALAAIDLDVHRLPDAIVLPAYAVGGLILTVSSLLVNDGAAIGRALIGAAALFFFYLALALVYPGGMGFGDVKLAGVLGLNLAWLGWSELAVGALAAFLLGGLFSLLLIITGRARRGSGIPFGPWMLGGAWIGIIAGEPVAREYLSLSGLS